MTIDNLVFETAVRCGVKHVQYAYSACVYSPKHQNKNGFQKLNEDLVDYDDSMSELTSQIQIMYTEIK